MDTCYWLQGPQWFPSQRASIAGFDSFCDVSLNKLLNKLTIIGLNYGLSPGRRPAIMWVNAVILLIVPSGTNFSEILIEIDIFARKAIENIVWKMGAILSRSQCVELNKDMDK